MIGRTQLSEVEEHLENAEKLIPKQDYESESAIRSIVDEIDNACDAKDWINLRKLFTDNIEVDFTSLSGGQPVTITADELVNSWKTNLYEEKKSFHQRTNHRIQINGDSAEVFSKAYAYNLIESGKVSGMWEVWGNYEHKLQRTTDGWKVSGMSLFVKHQRGDETVRTYLPEN